VNSLAKREGDSILSAAWLNARILNAMDRMEELMDRILYQGLLSSGYLPLESPVTKDMLARMTPEQVQAAALSMETLPEQAPAQTLPGQPPQAVI